MTTTVVAATHDAHVRARVSFVAARTAMVQVATTRRAAKAARNAARAANRRATKAQRAANVAAKEAAEKHASIVNKWTARCAARAAARAAAAPMVRAAKRTASMIAKVVKAANALRLAAIRVSRAAPRSTAVIKAAIVAIDRGVALSVTPVTTPVVAPTTVSIPAIVAFLAMTPCLCALWFYATFDIAARAADKEAAKAANKVHARIRAPRVPMNTPEKRASITMACNAVRAAVLHAQVKSGNAISNAKVVARAAQGAAQREANALRKAGMPAKVARPQVVIVRSGPAKNKGAKRVRAVRVHTVESVMAQVAKKAAIVKAKEDAQIAKAKKWALRKAAFANRKAAIEVIAADAWMLKGVWLPEDLLRAANDWSYSVRVGAFKEARAIAYAKAPATQVAVAA